MKEKLTFLLSKVVYSREKCFTVYFSRLFLGILSRVYPYILRWNLIRKPEKLPLPVISIGNIVTGGTGKTPAVETAARMVKSMGYRAAILSRGYGRKPAKKTAVPGVVSDGKRILLGVSEGGDEPQLLARNLPDVPVLVGKNRFITGSYAIKNFGVDVIILDDGFQHLQLKRDLDIAVIDSICPFGSGRLLPAGTLREPVNSLGRADILLLTHTDAGRGLENLKKKLRSINSRAPVLESIHSPVYLRNIATGEHEELRFLKGKKVFALSSIANPEYFENMVSSLGASAAESFRFPDHHRYSQAEIKRIKRIAGEKGIESIITTQKDAMRLEGMCDSDIDFLALFVELKITRGKEILEEKLRSILEKA